MVQKIEGALSRFKFRLYLLSLGTQVFREYASLFLPDFTPIKKPLIANNSILQINRFDRGGGAFKMAETLHHYLISAGWESRFALAEKKNQHTPGFTLRSRSKRERYFNQYLGLQDFHFRNWSLIQQERDFKQAGLIHLHNLHSEYFSYFDLLPLSKAKPLVFTLHDMHAFTGHCGYAMQCERWESGCGKCPDLNRYPSIGKDSTRFAWLMKQTVYQKMNRTQIVCPSQWLAKQAEKSILGQKHPIRVIHNGINTKVFRPANKSKVREKLNLPADAFIVLLVANQLFSSPYKGGEHIPSILKEFENDTKCLFLAAGAGKEEKGILTHPNLICLPFISAEEEMAEYYSAADLLLFPSAADNGPLAVLEAQASGLPVLSFRVGGIPEQVKESETGWLFEPNDVKGIVLALRELMQSPKILNTASNNARQWIIDSFSDEKMGAAYVSLYEELKNINKPIR
jgi:glycosyltransferase involved in cell wall biosynthesis